MGSAKSKPSCITEETWVIYQRDELRYLMEMKREEREREKEEREKQIHENKIKTRQAVVQFAEYMHHCHDCPRWMMVFPGNRERCSNARLALLDTGVDLAFNDDKLQDDMVQMVKNMK